VTPTLSTPRLLLPPLELADAPQIQLLFPHWEIVRYLAAQVPWPYPADGAYRHIRDMALPAVERGEAWHWTIRLKIGSRSNHRQHRPPQKRKRQSRLLARPPLATPRSNDRSLPSRHRFWFDTLNFSVLRAPKAVANVASRRISEKQGMRLIATEDRDYVSGRFPSEILEITAQEWRARKR